MRMTSAHSQVKHNKVTLLWSYRRRCCKKGKHLTSQERFYIEKRFAEGANKGTLTRELKISCSTITREMKRIPTLISRGATVQDVPKRSPVRDDEMPLPTRRFSN